MESCVFCKIARKEVPTKFLHEDELVVAFRDINPIAPVHILVIPRKHISSVNDLEEGDEKIMGRMIMAAKTVARELGISRDGYKLLVRTGRHGGQEVPHIHLHLLGGARLSEGIRPLK